MEGFWSSADAMILPLETLPFISSGTPLTAEASLLYNSSIIVVNILQEEDF